MNNDSNTLLDNLDSMNEDEFELALDFYFSVATQFRKPCVLLNDSFSILEVSPAFPALLNDDKEKIVHESFFTLLAEDEKDRFAKFIKDRELSGSFRYLNRNGSSHLMKTSVCYLKTAGNKKIFLLDLEETAHFERLKFENYRLQRILEQIPLSIIITDTAGNIEYVNPQFEKTTGYLSSEALGLNPRFLQSGEIPKEKYQHLWKVITAGKTWRGELHNKKKNGELFWEMASISGIKNDNGQLVNFIGVKEDITTRKIVYQQMIESEEQLRFLVETTGDVLYKFSHVNMRFDYMNPAIIKLTGYNAHEINEIGLPSIIQKVEVPDYGKRTDNTNSNQNIYGEKGDYHAEYLIKTKGGELKWIEDHSFPWYDSLGELIGSVGILTDIANRKAMHLEILRAKAESESMNKLKSNFLANISHELRTPLISILGYSDIVKEMAEDSEIKELTGIIHQSANRLTETINLILDLTMLEAENESLNLIPVRLSEIVEMVVEPYKDSAIQKGISFNYADAVTSNICVLCEARMLKQVLNQLVNNAFKYTQSGAIGIKTESREDEVVISVSDTGIGIRKEDFRIVFDEFRQVSEGLGRSFEGSGLGLNISKRFVEKMNGRIWVESEEGKGSVFLVAVKKAEC